MDASENSGGFLQISHLFIGFSTILTIGKHNPLILTIDPNFQRDIQVGGSFKIDGLVVVLCLINSHVRYTVYIQFLYNPYIITNVYIIPIFYPYIYIYIIPI